MIQRQQRRTIHETLENVSSGLIVDRNAFRRDSAWLPAIQHSLPERQKKAAMNGTVDELTGMSR
jgi:hypothetical protein